MEENNISIQYPIAINKGLGELAATSDFAEHVEHMIKQLLLTKPGERINRPDFGCGIFHMVFSPNSSEIASLAEVTIYQALDRWLGDLITIEKVKVTSVDATMEISISYILKIKREHRYLNIEVSS